MTFQELALRIFYAAQPLLPFLGAVGVSTCALLAALLLLSRGLWFDRPAFRWLGLFYGLGKYDCVRLGSAWVKLSLLLSYLIAFQKLEGIHYLVILIPSLLFSIQIRSPKGIPANLLGCLMELVGLGAANVVCGYIRDFHPGAGFVVVYVLISLFLALYGVYLFLTELNVISNGRRILIED